MLFIVMGYFKICLINVLIISIKKGLSKSIILIKRINNETMQKILKTHK